MYALYLGARLRGRTATQRSKKGSEKVLGWFLESGQVRPRQGTEICNFRAPSPSEALHWIFCFFSSIYVQFSKTSPLKSGENSEKSSGENRIKSCHVCGCHGFFGPDRRIMRKKQGGPGSVRFGHGLGRDWFKRFRFRFWRFLCKKGFSERFRFWFRFLENGSGGSGFAFGFGKRFRRFRFLVPVCFLNHPEKGF